MKYVKREDNIRVLDPEPAEQRKLEKLGIRTVQDLLNASGESLEKLKRVREQKKLLQMGRGNYILENWGREIPCRRGAMQWKLGDDGELRISGWGKMSDFSDMLVPPWKHRQGEIRALRLEDGVENLGGRAFEDALGLETVFLAESVTSLDFRSFAGCTGLREVHTPCRLTDWRECGEEPEDKACYVGRDAFLGAGWKPAYQEGFLIRDGVLLASFEDEETVTIPEGVREIGAMAFEGRPVRRLTLPKSLRRIGLCAFRGTEIEELKIHRGLEYIGPWAFSNNDRLKKVILPGKRVVVEPTAFAQTPVESDYRPEGKWLPISELAQVEEPGLGQYRRMIPRERETGMGVRRSNLRRDVIKLMNEGQLVLRIRIDEDRKQVEYVQGFTKRPGIGYMTPLMYPCSEDDGSFGIWSDSVTYLEDEDIHTMDLSSLRPAKKGKNKYLWYCAPFRPFGQYDMPYELLRNWKAQHPEYNLYSKEESSKLSVYRMFVPC